MNRKASWLDFSYAWLVMSMLYAPLLAIALASFSQKRYFAFPVKRFSTEWYEKAVSSITVSELVTTSLLIALFVTVIAVTVGFFAALAYARYDWKGRRLFQKVVLLPLFFPQTVLGLALLMWFNFLGITPCWKTAIIAHVAWISPITTLIIAIQAYKLDHSLEEAAYDLGATRLQVLVQVTFPLLVQAIFSAALFAFLLSWGNFALSLFTTGADSTLPEWLYAKMISGYSPLIPAVGSMAIGAAIALIIGLFTLRAWHQSYLRSIQQFSATLGMKYE